MQEIIIKISLSALIALFVGRFIIKPKQSREIISNTLLNAVGAYVLGLKLSLFFTHIMQIANEPLILIFYWGNSTNKWIGISFTVAYLLWFFIRKSDQPKRHLIYSLVVLGSFALLFNVSNLVYNAQPKPKQLKLESLSDMFDIYGEKIKLDHTQKTYLNFWATWCPPCRGEMPELEAFHTIHPHFNFITINSISSEKQGIEGVKAFLSEKGYTFPVLPDFGNKLVDYYEIGSYPTTLVFDKNGNLIDEHVGPISLGELTSY